MRKILETISLLTLALLFFMTFRAFYGPNRLPDRIATHFNATGQADGWGSPVALLVFPIMAIGIYLLMTLVSRFPGAFNFPVRVTSQNRHQLEKLALNMIAWLKAEIVVFFTSMSAEANRAARHPDHRFSPFLMPMLLGAVFLTCILHIIAIFRAGSNTSRN
jgi:uncharacterized membrane protein